MQSPQSAPRGDSENGPAAIGILTINVASKPGGSIEISVSRLSQASSNIVAVGAVRLGTKAVNGCHRTPGIREYSPEAVGSARSGGPIEVPLNGQKKASIRVVTFTTDADAKAKQRTQSAFGVYVEECASAVGSTCCGRTVQIPVGALRERSLRDLPVGPVEICQCGEHLCRHRHDRRPKHRQHRARNPAGTVSHGFAPHGVTVNVCVLIAMPPCVWIPTGPVFAPPGTVAVTCVSEFTVNGAGL